MVVKDLRCGSLIFSSNFDSGNLASVEQVLRTNDVETVEQSYSDPNEVDFEYKLWTSPDASGTIRENGNRSWFHFSVRGPLSSKIVRFHIMNMNKQCNLYAQGMSPVFRMLPGNNATWKRIKDKPTFEFLDGQFVLTFTHHFIDVSRFSTTYFAFCYPFSYDECQEYLHQLEMKYSTENSVADIYFHRDTLCYSIDGLKLDLLTISSTKDLQNIHEETLVNLYPDQNKKRAHKFKNKKIFFLTSRVHPGETPSSFVFNGFLEFILRENDPRSMMLRDTFIFKLIPMLNPDGVKRGHYRTDAFGLNLNRVYVDPDPILQPTIYAVKEAMLYYHFDGDCNKKKKMHLRTKSDPIVTKNLVNHVYLRKSKTKPDVRVISSHNDEFGQKSTIDFQRNDYNSDNLNSKHSDEQSRDKGSLNFAPYHGNIAIYVDLHGHASKRGCFMYGNYFEKEKDLVECMLFPKLISMNSSHFDFQACNFSEKNMYHTDRRDGLSKAGSGRVAMFKCLHIVHSYTLECNYNTGQCTNPIAAATCDNGRATPPPLPGFPPRYTPEHYAEVGKGMAVAALDFFQKNPWSRLPLSDLKSLTGVRDWLAKFIRNSTKAISVCSKRKTQLNKCNGRDSDKPSKNTVPLNSKPVSRQTSRPTINNNKTIDLSRKGLRQESSCLKTSRNTVTRNDDNVTVINITLDEQKKNPSNHNKKSTVVGKVKKTPLYCLHTCAQSAPAQKPLKNFDERQSGFDEKQKDKRRENDEQNPSTRKPLKKSFNTSKRPSFVISHSKVSPNTRKISPNLVVMSVKRKVKLTDSPLVNRQGTNSPQERKGTSRLRKSWK